MFLWEKMSRQQPGQPGASVSWDGILYKIYIKYKKYIKYGLAAQKQCKEWKRTRKYAQNFIWSMFKVIAYSFIFGMIMR